MTTEAKNYEELKRIIENAGYSKIDENFDGTEPNKEFRSGIWISSNGILKIEKINQYNLKLEFCREISLDCNTRINRDTPVIPAYGITF